MSIAGRPQKHDVRFLECAPRRKWTCGPRRRPRGVERERRENRTPSAGGGLGARKENPHHPVAARALQDCQPPYRAGFFGAVVFQKLASSDVNLTRTPLRSRNRREKILLYKKYHIRAMVCTQP